MIITFVCTGNICRSPMAEKLFRKMLDERGKSNIIVNSRGILMSGLPISDYAAEILSRHGICGLDHRSEIFAKEDCAADKIYCMTREHKKWLLSAFDGIEDKVSVLGGGIDDPFSGSIEHYERAETEILAALRDVYAELFMRIEPMGVEHAEAVSLIEEQSKRPPYTKAQILEELSNEYAFANVLTDGGEVVGYVIAHVMFEECSIITIAVDERRRRQGAGRLLLCDIINHGYKRVILEVRQSNLSAIALYKSVGFIQIAIREHFYTNPTETALVFEWVRGN